MRHWYLLLKEQQRTRCRRELGAPCGFVAYDGPDFTEVVAPPNVRRRLFVLGAVEILPIVGSFGLAHLFEPTLPYAGTFASGFALSILVCWLLRNHTPPTIIHAVPTLEAPTEETHDTKQDIA